MTRRGDVIIVDFPFADGRSGKIRPALVVQNDRDNARMANTIVAMISGDLRHRSEPTQFFIDPGTPDGKTSGLHGPSVVKCGHLLTIAQAGVLRSIGSLPHTSMQSINTCLKVALAIP
jgi:mRNA interferase MazF